MKNKKLVVISSIFIIIISIGVSLYAIFHKPDKNVVSNPNGVEVNTKEEVLKEATIKNLKVKNISLTTKDGISTYKAELHNNTTSSISIDKLYVIFYIKGKENKILAASNISINKSGKTYINLTSETDLSKTDKITYEAE